MTPRQQRFVTEYARLKNGKQAALAAGYAPCCAEAVASRALRNPKVAAALVEAGVELAFIVAESGGQRRVMPFLTERQRRFVEHYLILGNAAEAARRAGYSRRSALGISSRLMAMPHVAAAIEAGNAARAARTRIDAQRVLTEFARIGFIDPAMLIEFGEDGPRLKPLDAMAPDDRAAVAEIIMTETKAGSRIRLRFCDKQRALENMAKHLGLFKDGAAQRLNPPKSKEERAELRERLLKLIRGGGEK